MHVMNSIFRVGIFALCLSLPLAAVPAPVHMQTSDAGNVYISGGDVIVATPVKQDLRTAGGSVDIEANTGGELVAAGSNVRVAGSATVAGSAWLAGWAVWLQRRYRAGSVLPD